MSRYRRTHRCRQRACLRSFWQCERAAAMMEFAFALPLLSLLALGGSEVFYYLRTVARMEKTVSNVGTILAQMTRVSEEDVERLFVQAEEVMGEKGGHRHRMRMRIRQYGCDERSCAFHWWREGAGEGKIAEGKYHALPSALQVQPKEHLVHVKLWLEYQPLISQVVGIGGQVLEREGYYRTSNDYPLDKVLEVKR